MNKGIIILIVIISLLVIAVIVTGSIFAVAISKRQTQALDCIDNMNNTDPYCNSRDKVPCSDMTNYKKSLCETDSCCKWSPSNK